MNTNGLKKFAQAARKKLLEQVAARLDYVLSHDTAELRGKAASLKSMKDAITELGKAALIDKVAYTWFNRFLALRFMDANAYQPIGMAVITPVGGSLSPQLLSEAHAGNIPQELQLNSALVMDILDGRVSSNNPDNDAYRILIVAACNQLHQIFPFLFEKINDYTELLMPDDLCSPFSILYDFVKGMSEEDCQEVEIIGWLYQFYISERKDEVFASKSKVKKEDIPAATQLFTPRWIVEYMVQNTLGKLWLQNKPNSRLRDYMPYFIESPTLETDDFLKINSPEEIKLLDQACGSGHILVYGFELFSKMYEEEGYNQNEIASLILKKNLFGFEIDERAAQLAAFALIMKARAYQRRLFKKEIATPNILCYKDLNITTEAVAELLKNIGIKANEALLQDLSDMQQACNLGSLIMPRTSLSELQSLLDRVKKEAEGQSSLYNFQLPDLQLALEQLILLAEKYHCVVDNPPYMGGGNMNNQLADFVKKNYPDSKADLMACFMEAGLKILHPKGFMGMINQHSWMFLSSYEALRKKLIESTFFDTLLHLGPRTFPEIGGEVVQNAAFTFWNNIYDAKGAYLRLVDFKSSEEKSTKTLEAIQNPNCGWFYTADQNDFEKIPGSPIGYWLSAQFYKSFEQKKIKEIYTPKQGLATGRNERFLRYWHEVQNLDFHTNYLSIKESNSQGANWVPYSKGGAFRKWYGNHEYVVFWKDSGEIIRNFKDVNGKELSRFRAAAYYFREGVTWSLTSSSNGGFACRIRPKGFVFDINGMSLFESVNNINKVTCLLNSIVGTSFLRVINPTMAYQIGDIGSVPFLDGINTEIFNSEENIAISKLEWDSRETSWDFQQNELIRLKGQDLEETYDLYQQYWHNKFFQLHKNEEELNRQFIGIYGLQEELTPDVPLEEITILKEETSIENGQLVFKAGEVFAQFMSYAVGCMFGRYSLDKEGLILANQGESLKDYLEKLSKTEAELSFVPDEDNILPVLDDEWFEDDIVARFHAFLRASFGERYFQKNLDFVEDCLGKKIRKYFTKDFYKDHIKRYKKRPIYWMFSSPKGHFNVLVYLQRYTADTLNTILNSYLREFVEKLGLHKKQLEHILSAGNASEQNKARKEIDKIEEMLLDCRQYEQLLYPLASLRIALDLDDGVLVNYNKLGKAVAEVAGLNDKATKKKVKEFDWIDNTQIR